MTETKVALPQYGGALNCLAPILHWPMSTIPPNGWLTSRHGTLFQMR
jgi:hypothetical protein